MEEKVFLYVRAVDVRNTKQSSERCEDDSLKATSSAAIPPNIDHPPTNSRSRDAGESDIAEEQMTTHTPLPHGHTPLASLRLESLESGPSRSTYLEIQDMDEGVIPIVALHKRHTAVLNSKGKERQAIMGECTSEDEEFAAPRPERDDPPLAQALGIAGTPVAIGEATESDYPPSASPGTSLLMTAAATRETTSRADEEISGQEQLMDSLHSSVTDDAARGDRGHSSGRRNEEARDNTAGDDSDRLGEIGAMQDSSTELGD